MIAISNHVYLSINIILNEFDNIFNRIQLTNEVIVSCTLIVCNYSETLADTFVVIERMSYIRSVLQYHIGIWSVIR